VFIVKFPVTVVVADVAISLVNRAIALNIMLEVRFVVKVGVRLRGRCLDGGQWRN